METIGIYVICSRIKPNRFYIGLTRNFEKRKMTHTKTLKYHKHPNRRLQLHCNKYGVDDLYFLIYHFCDEKELLYMEGKIIKELKPYFNMVTKVPKWTENI
jgi:group I intron endonuclease